MNFHIYQRYKFNVSCNCCTSHCKMLCECVLHTIYVLLFYNWGVFTENVKWINKNHRVVLHTITIWFVFSWFFIELLGHLKEAPHALFVRRALFWPDLPSKNQLFGVLLSPVALLLSYHNTAETNWDSKLHQGVCVWKHQRYWCL